MEELKEATAEIVVVAEVEVAEVEVDPVAEVPAEDLTEGTEVDVLADQAMDDKEVEIVERTVDDELHKISNNKRTAKAVLLFVLCIDSPVLDCDLLCGPIDSCITRVIFRVFSWTVLENWTKDLAPTFEVVPHIECIVTDGLPQGVCC